MTTKLLAPVVATAPLLKGTGWPRQGDWQYADYLRLAEDGRRYEIIKGVLYMDYAPDFDHQFVLTQLFFQLNSFAFAHKLGIVISAPFEVHLSQTTSPVQPDLLFLRTEQIPGHGTKFYDGAPPLVVEIISPTSIRRDRIVKFDLYEAEGVEEYWLVDPKTRSVEVYVRSSGEYALHGQFVNDDVITSVLLTGLTITTCTLFLP